MIRVVKQPMPEGWSAEKLLEHTGKFNITRDVINLQTRLMPTFYEKIGRMEGYCEMLQVCRCDGAFEIRIEKNCVIRTGILVVYEDERPLEVLRELYHVALQISSVREVEQMTITIGFTKQLHFEGIYEMVTQH